MLGGFLLTKIILIFEDYLKDLKLIESKLDLYDGKKLYLLSNGKFYTLISISICNDFLKIVLPDKKSLLIIMMQGCLRFNLLKQNPLLFYGFIICQILKTWKFSGGGERGDFLYNTVETKCDHTYFAKVCLFKRKTN